LDSALQTLLGQTVCYSGMECGAVFTLEGEHARLRHQIGLPPEMVAEVACRPLTTPYIQHALANPDEIFDVTTRFPELTKVAKYGIQHFYCIPLVLDQQPFGFINVATHRVEPAQAAELELIRILTWETVAVLTRLNLAQRYRSTLAAMAEGVVMQLADGAIMDCNPSAERILGMSRDQIMGRKSVDPRWRAVRENGEPFPGTEHPAMVSLRTGQPCHNVVMGIHLPDRTQRWININAEPIFQSGQTVPYAVVATFDDITQRVQMVKSLQASEGQLRRVGDNLPNGMVYQLLSHPDGRRQFLYVSAGVEKLHGVTADKVCADATLLYSQILEQDRPYVAAKEAECIQTVSTFSAQVRFCKPNGEVRWMQLSSAPTQFPDGAILWDGLAIDITEAKRMEEHLRQAQKMEGIGLLAGGIAHEFNNILAALMPGLAMLEEAVTSPENVEVLQQMQTLTGRAAGLVKQMLAFSRQSVLQREPYDLAADIPVQIRLLNRLLGERIVVEYSLPHDLPWVNADKNLIAQVLMNLAVNARDAMNGVGKLRISLDAVILDADRVKTMPNVHAGEFLCLSVADTGCGMNREILDHLFEPFFSTKPVGQGTGLGLATVQGILQQHHGWVKVESVVGVGTTFRIYLPTTTAQAPKPPTDAKEMVRGTGTILVVDDEANVRLVTRKLLVRLGYVVLEAGSGNEAMVIWGQHHDAIDLVLTDMVMPGDLTGHQLADLILEEKPTVKVIITSGYNNEIFDLTKMAQSQIVYLPKPCETAALTQVIRNCLSPKK
jgi:PAS domain S-box-containing protein